MSSAEPIPLDPNFRIELPAFEGPLDLLLHVITKHELDILDLPISFVTEEKYLEYLNLMNELNLDMASEYLVMAAKLAHIKSKMLLPTPPVEQEDEDEEQGDPRHELIRRLLEYQKYKQVAEQLGNRSVAGRDVFMRGTEPVKHEGTTGLASIDVFKLLDAFQKVLKRIGDAQAFGIDAERVSIQDRIHQITDLLQTRKTCAFDELFEEARTKYDVVVTLLAVLEMTKMHMLRVYQNDPLAPIHLEYRLLDASVGTYPPPSGAITSDRPDAAGVEVEGDVAVESEQAFWAAENDEDESELPADADGDEQVEAEDRQAVDEPEPAFVHATASKDVAGYPE